MPAPHLKKLVCVAAVAGPHGVRGAFKLRCFTAVATNVAAYGPVHDEKGQELFELNVVGQATGGVIATAPGITSRDAAEALRGRRLYVPRARLPELADENEFYHEDLIGLEAIGKTGRLLGKVTAVLTHGAGDIIEFSNEQGEVEAVPFTRVNVPVIDLPGGRIVVVMPDKRGGRSGGRKGGLK